MFKFIESYIRKHGYSPSYTEIAEANNMRTRSHVHQFITNLEKRKWIKRIPGTARSIEIL